MDNKMCLLCKYSKEKDKNVSDIFDMLKNGTTYDEKNIDENKYRCIKCQCTYPSDN